MSELSKDVRVTARGDICQDSRSKNISWLRFMFILIAYFSHFVHMIIMSKMMMMMFVMIDADKFPGMILGVCLLVT